MNNNLVPPIALVVRIVYWAWDRWHDAEPRTNELAGCWHDVDGEQEEEEAGMRIVDLADVATAARPCVYCEADGAPLRELRRVREGGTVDRNGVYVCQACINDGPGVDVLARLLQERIDTAGARLGLTPPTSRLVAQRVLAHHQREQDEVRREWARSIRKGRTARERVAGDLGAERWARGLRTCYNR